MADDRCATPNEKAVRNPLYIENEVIPNTRNSDKIKVAGLVIQILTFSAVAFVLFVCIAILATTLSGDKLGPTNPPLALKSTSICASAFPSNITCNCTCPHSPGTFSNNNMSILLDGISQLLDITKSTLDITNNASERSDRTLYDIVGSLANIKQTSTTTSGAANDILSAVEDILDIQNKKFILNHIQKVSCKDIKSVYPSSSSGYYHLNGQTVYCNMGSLCGSGGGWTRLAYLDMTDATQSCPSGFRLYTSGNVRACGRFHSSQASCTSSVKFETNGISYSEICGRITGYQYASPDAVSNIDSPTFNIDSYYVDGVSITRGSPRQHVWTLMAGLSDSTNLPYYNCPCNNPPPSEQTIPAFIGSNYFCESGNRGSWYIRNRLYTGDPLWDGKGCGPIETPCCAAPGLPWFHRDYGSTTITDYIELRVCGDESTYNEDVLVSFYEIYVK